MEKDNLPLSHPPSIVREPLPTLKQAIMVDSVNTSDWENASKVC